MSLTGEVTMGRKRPEGKKPVQIKTVGVRATLPWVQWLEQGAEFCRTDTSKLIDAALTDYLKAKGFPKAPPRRTP